MQTREFLQFLLLPQRRWREAGHSEGVKVVKYLKTLPDYITDRSREDSPARLQSAQEHHSVTKPPQSKLQNIQNNIIEKPTGNNRDGKVTFLGSQPYPHSSHMPFGETLKGKKKAKPSQPPCLKIKTECTRAFCVTSMVEQCCQQLASQAFLLMPQCVKDIFNDRSRALLSVRCLSCVNSSLLGTQIPCPTREAVKVGRHHKAGEISVQTALLLSWLLLSYLQGISSEVSLNIFLLLLS